MCADLTWRHLCGAQLKDARSPCRTAGRRAGELLLAAGAGKLSWSQVLTGALTEPQLAEAGVVSGTRLSGTLRLPWVPTLVLTRALHIPMALIPARLRSRPQPRVSIPVQALMSAARLDNPVCSHSTWGLRHWRSQHRECTAALCHAEL